MTRELGHDTLCQPFPNDGTYQWHAEYPDERKIGLSSSFASAIVFGVNSCHYTSADALVMMMRAYRYWIILVLKEVR